MKPFHAPLSRLVKTAYRGVLGRVPPCDVPQGYDSVAPLPAALPHAVLTSRFTD